MADNADTIAANSLKAKKLTGDAGSIEQHSIQDQIAADQYAKASAAAKRPRKALRFAPLIPPGAS
jgi:hypothetical protein